MDESEIPIDIHTSKLMDWLVSRRHVPKDWNSKVLTVREKINEAIKDMPENEEITKLLSGTYINYYHCKKIIEILKETEVSSKNLFGQYTSKRMKDWVEIVKLYEKDNVYLGEVASLLQRYVNYEVPALKKQITKITNLKSEYDKKEVTYERSAQTTMNDFKAACQSLGIKGDKIKKELVEKAKDFPSMCNEAAKKMKTLKEAAMFYVNVVNSLLNAKTHPLEILQFVIENGNTTVYQWKYKKVPSSVEAAPMIVAEDEDDNKNQDDDVIDFGLDLDEPSVDEEIDWGISTVESDGIESVEVVDDSQKNGGEEESVARGEEAQSLLGNPETRNLVLNDVLELETFLKVRVHEMVTEEDGLGLTMLPESMQAYDVKAVRKMLESVDAVKQELTNPASLQYLNITTNQRFVDQLADKLKQKLTTHEKMLASKEVVKQQRAESIKEAQAMQPKVQVLIEKAKQLQGTIEEDISKRYKGRPVNLIAGANML